MAILRLDWQFNILSVSGHFGPEYDPRIIAQKLFDDQKTKVKKWWDWSEDKKKPIWEIESDLLMQPEYFNKVKPLKENLKKEMQEKYSLIWQDDRRTSSGDLEFVIQDNKTKKYFKGTTDTGGATSHQSTDFIECFPFDTPAGVIYY